MSSDEIEEELAGPSAKRRRMDTNSAEPRQHERLWFNDGNIVLVADDIAFRLHRGVLSLQSSVLNALLVELERSGHDEEIDGCPVVRVSDSKSAMTQFLVLLYEGGQDPFFASGKFIEIPIIRSMVLLSIKYDVKFIREEALRRIHCHFPRALADRDHLIAKKTQTFSSEDCVAIIHLARSCGDTSLLPYAFFRLSCDQTLGDITKMVYYDDGDLEFLTYGDIEICLKLLDKLIASSHERARLWLEIALPWPCGRPKPCGDALKAFALDIHKSNRLSHRHILDNLETPMKEFRMKRAAEKATAWCPECAEVLLRRDNIIREKVWKYLGVTAGIQPWPPVEQTEMGPRGA